MGDRGRTLEELDGRWPEPSEDSTGLIIRCHRLRRVSLRQLAAGDLRLLLGQDIGTRHILELAVELVEREPLLDAEYYEGDLLVAILRLPQARHTGLRARIERILERALLAPLVLQAAREHGWR